MPEASLNEVIRQFQARTYSGAALDLSSVWPNKGSRLELNRFERALSSCAREGGFGDELCHNVVTDAPKRTHTAANSTDGSLLGTRIRTHYIARNNTMPDGGPGIPHSAPPDICTHQTHEQDARIERFSNG